MFNISPLHDQIAARQCVNALALRAGRLRETAEEYMQLIFDQMTMEEEKCRRGVTKILKERRACIDARIAELGGSQRVMDRADEFKFRAVQATYAARNLCIQWDLPIEIISE